ncbi:dephospho-CoA kinase [Rubinisphaera margarita]|uniref:dephospho-CoA kinase n=1 Tax=Rubinisphaera margarita TaxID=2909586 RepID=UPI001EE8C0AB|nr:dephospho-CoA kinase [Rubinisphaera margarita]MCG6155457.1 dephospho-CoA kinase [Rubinisphaera margarita]
MSPSENRFAVLGLIGGVGSGKSTLSRWLAERLPVTRIDGDELGHRALKVNPVRTELVGRFGAGILNPDGEIHRAALGRLVWGEDQTAIENRRVLESIVHPEIRRMMDSQVEAARNSRQLGIILDAAVMLESGWAGICDKIVFIETPEQNRRNYVVQGRGWTEDQWKQRERSQWSLAEKRKRADAVIDNSGTLEAAGTQLQNYVEQTFGWRQE